MKHLHIFFMIFGAVCMVGVGVLVFLGYTLSQPVNPGSTATQQFVIANGQSVSAIAQKLETAGLVKNALVFRLIVRRNNLDTNLQAGSFDLSPALTPQQIAEKLTQGTADIWVTIPEGLRAEEITALFAASELSAFDSVDFLSLTKGSEGRLFPDTYLVPKQSSATLLASLLENTFEQKITTQFADEIAASDHTFEELLIMASLIQREARQYDQMRHVSSILWNRIAIDMPLQVDATLQYAKGFSASEQKWWSTPLKDDKQLVSPYNTYLNPGLPPAPICNPGEDAFRAALTPLATDDLYYLHAPSGEMYFGATLEEHNANVQRYLR